MHHIKCLSNFYVAKDPQKPVSSNGQMPNGPCTKVELSSVPSVGYLGSKYILYDCTPYL